MQQAPYLVKMVNIGKRFGAVQALRKVSVEVRYNEILGLLGDNGAGKSPLIKILAGVYPPDGGEIYFEGKRVNFSSPKEARARGIETVHQELSLVNIMSISRNFFLGREPTRRIGPITLLERRRMDAECKRDVTEIGVRNWSKAILTTDIDTTLLETFSTTSEKPLLKPSGVPFTNSP